MPFSRLKSILLRSIITPPLHFQSIAIITFKFQERTISLKKLEQLIPALFKLNPDHLPDYQPSVAAFHKILFASLHFIANGNVVPQIVQLGNKDFIIRWLPALIDSEVRLLTEKLDKLLPPGLLLSPKIIRKAEQLLLIENQTNELLSIVISKLVAHLSRSSNGNLFEDIFFKNKAYSFSGVGENALSGGMKVWLDRFHLTTGNYKPVIAVSELDNEQFDVQISIEDTSVSDQLPVPVSKILQEKQYEKQRFKILQTLSLLSPFIRGLDTHINLGGNHPILFNKVEFAPFLIEVLPAVRLLDIKIMLPKSLQELLRPKPTVKLRRNAEQQGYVRLDDLLSFDWQVAIGDALMSPDEFKKLLKNVMVHRMITKNTFEERIDEMIQKKKHLADMTVATGENWIGKLSNKELREIFG